MMFKTGHDLHRSLGNPENKPLTAERSGMFTFCSKLTVSWTWFGALSLLSY